MLQEYINYHSGTFEFGNFVITFISYAYHMRLIVQQTSILPALKHVHSP